ncbi:unnamed protein product [Paramecium pentaurelia]|uniref:non-specific serine/threonine protein kinase n=1 Tax=Paramecium pentaurelia TaxID=43138 RepID=A0A8S1T9L2_9CILI|nr:unnamed protein product [Paramecium pentaurelia]
MKSILTQASKIPKYYADFNTHQPKHYWDYENYKTQFGHQDDYEIYEKIGQGRYSEVFKGVSIRTHQNVIIKVLKPNVPEKINREILILKNLQSHPLITELVDVVQDYSSLRQSLIFKQENCINLKDIRYYESLKPIKFLIKSVLEALDYCHSIGIFHRDIKPHNILTNTQFSCFKLLDWGLAEFYHPNKEYNTRVASRYFKSPEILLDFRQYHHSIDSWGVGCLMAGMIFQKEPFFAGISNDDQLLKIINILGSDVLYTYLNKWKINIPTRYKSIPYSSQKRFELFITKENENLCTPEAIDLLKQLLIFDHSDRILPKDALQHPFFQ